MGIVVIGAVFMDLKDIPSLYISGRKCRNLRPRRSVQKCGGDIANVELKPTFVSLVDDNPWREDIIRKLDRHKVTPKYYPQTAGWHKVPGWRCI